ncbi:hypothetical protein Tcan_07323 [Toxocara canis]|uniref:Uncharacterized protein n=1 Tax=Toxocara canis TaxID=6265 RepID=A0A0B2V362_TOXCA|nr:hypothetical protein Tcan_07323 [Toxocara canis]
MEYARKVRKTEGRKVEAYQADFGSLFPVYTRKRQTPLPAKLLFGDKALIKDAHNPLLLRRQMDAEVCEDDGFYCEDPSTPQSPVAHSLQLLALKNPFWPRAVSYKFSITIPDKPGDESGENSAQSPVIIGTFPLPTQQSAMLDSLTSTVIMHHCHLSSATIFKYGVVHLVTFLSAGNYAAAMCAIDEDLRFMSNAQRHQSWLLNRLFEVKSLRDRKGFSRNTFSPVIPLQKTIAYEKKLAEVGIRNGLMYGVSIRPRCSLQIGPLTVVSSVGAESAAGEVINASEVLLKYAFWLAITGKLTAKTNVYDRLRQWFPESGSKIASEIGSTTKVTDLELRNFDVLFNILHNDMNETCALNNEMAKFIAKFKPASTSKKFAD